MLQAVDASFGEFLTACPAGVLVSIARVLELRTSFEELNDELVGLATHADGGEGCRSDVLFLRLVMIETLLPEKSHRLLTEVSMTVSLYLVK